MLVPNSITSTAQAKSYFFEKDNYYLNGEGQKLTQWWGNGAKRLGLSGQVDPDRFQEILEGRIDEHTQIGLRLDGAVSHCPGSDLTFMAPKSVSILGFIGDDQRICDAHMNAVKVSMGEVERMCARAKFSKKEGAIFENSNNLIAALFPHDTSRLLDPHMHTHAVVMNATLRSDGMWRALASEMGYEKLNGYMERVNAWQIYFGNIYRTELAKELKSLGYEIRPAGKNGQFEIKGIPQEVLEHFSQRRKQITDIVGNRTASKFNDIVAKATREPKQAADRGELKAHWDNEIKKMNFDARAFVQQAMSASTMPGQAQDKADLTLAAAFVQSAVELLSVWGTSFSFDQLFNKVAMIGMGEIAHSQIKTEINNQLKSGQLISLDRAGTKLTTQSLLDKEQSIVERAGALSAQKPKSKDIDGLSDAAKLALKHNISVINVSASRQFELLESSLSEIESQGYKVHLLSPNRDTAKDLSSNVKRDNSGLFKWFRNIGKPQIGQTVRGFVYRQVERSKSPLAFLSHGKHVAVIDNAHKLSVHDVNSLLELSHKDGTHIVFLNNTKGLISSHNTLELLSKANVPSTTIQTGDYNNKLVMSLCTQSMKLDLATGNTLIVTDSKRRIAPLTQEVRNELKYQGKLSREEIVVTGLKPQYIDPTRMSAKDFSTGNMLRLYYRDRPFEDFKVLGSIAGQGILNVETLSGRAKKLRLKELRGGNFKLFESSELKLARGDKVRGTATMQKEGIEASVNYRVIDVNDKYMVLSNGDKQLKLSSKNTHLPLEHDYVRTISQAAGSFDKVILDAKAYSISSNLINELSAIASTIDIHTDDVSKAERVIHKAVHRQSATDLVLNTRTEPQVLDCSNIEAFKKTLGDTVESLVAVQNRDELSKALDQVIDHLSEREAAFCFDAVFNELANLQMGKAGCDDLKAVIKEHFSNGELVKGSGGLFTTPKALAFENSTIDNINAGKGRLVPIMESDSVKVSLEGSYLTSSQKDAVNMILSSQDQFVAVQGFAGTGKSALLNAVQNISGTKIYHSRIILRDF